MVFQPHHSHHLLAVLMCVIKLIAAGHLAPQPVLAWTLVVLQSSLSQSSCTCHQAVGKQLYPALLIRAQCLHWVLYQLERWLPRMGVLHASRAPRRSLWQPCLQCMVPVTSMLCLVALT